MFLQIVYVSMAGPINKSGLLQLLEESRRLNAIQDITGMLLYLDPQFKHVANGRFIQAIEGPINAVDKLFDNIRNDCRHSHVLLLNRRVIKNRDFSDWKMGFKAINEAAFQSQPGFFSLTPDFLDQKNDSRWNVALDYLKRFYQLRMKIKD